VGASLIRAVRYGLFSVALLCGCATFVPPQSGIVRTTEARSRLPSPLTPAIAIVGDIGVPSREGRTLVGRMAERLRGTADAPVLVLGDVFYRDGLLGMCPDGGKPRRSARGCANPTPPEVQLEAVLRPYREGLPGHPLVAVAGNHDHYGDPDATTNACRLIPAFAPDWSYLASGCGLDEGRTVGVVDLGDVIVFVVDSEQMIRDAAFRAESSRALARAVLEATRERPEAWRVLASHHPLESYGSHNGARTLTALRKDLYWVSQTLLFPISWLLDRTVLERVGHQDVYERRYRAFRREVYGALRDAPVDLVVSGHDHSLQLIRIEHPGVGHQLVSGAGTYRTPVKRYGLDLYFSNRLARLVGLGDLLPAPSHRLLFAAGGAAGLGYAVLVPDGEQLVVEIHGTRVSEPLVTYELRRGAQLASS
jgi:hypothetical protein